MTSTVASVTTPHPFTRLQNPSRWEIVRMFLGLLSGFVLIRLLLLVISVMIGGSLTVAFHHLRLRSLSVYNLRLTCRWILLVMGYIRIPCTFETGSSNTNSKNNANDFFATGNCPKIIVTNHVSFVEILHLLTLPFRDDCGKPVLPAFVTKESVFGLPIVGTITRDILGSIGVARTANEEPQQPSSIDRIETKATGGGGVTEQILSRVHGSSSSRSGPIVIFPEGTTTNGTCLLAFKRGAFVPLVAIQPVLYFFGKNAYDTQRSDFLPTLDSIWAPAYIWRYLSQPIHKFSGQFLHPIAPKAAGEDGDKGGYPNYNINGKGNASNNGRNETQNGNDSSPASLFAEQVRSEMSRKGNLPILSTDYNYGHKLHYHEKLTEAFKAHPRGPLHAMCFAPMQKVLPSRGDADGKDDDNDTNKDTANIIANNDETDIGYDVVVGTTFVPNAHP